MGKADFVASRHKSWQEMENLLSKITSRGIRSLEEDELLALGKLYRSASTDLAKARSAEPYGDVTFYLNKLVGRTHSIIYSGQTRPFRGIWTFFSQEFPSLVRKHSRVVLLSTLIFVLPGLLGFYWMSVEPLTVETMFPQVHSMLEEMESALKDKPSLLASGLIEKEYMPEASSEIMVNNIKVSIYAFSLGITFGLGTVYIMTFNGILLGAVSYLYFSRPMEYGIYFLAGILPHGVIELTAIVLSGAAGFIIAGALLMPGNLRRVDALRIRGRDAIRIIYGVISMLVIAGLIEAFITPIHAGDYESLLNWVKIAGSVIIFSLLMIYFRFTGRNAEA